MNSLDYDLIVGRNPSILKKNARRHGFGGEPELGETFDQTLDVKLNSAAMQPIRIAYDVRRHGVQQPVVRDSALPLTISSFQLFPSSLNECLYRRAV